MAIKFPPLRDVLHNYDLVARKSLGQHFLLDENITHSIVKVSGNLEGINVIEVGAGPGGLTRSLLQSNAAHLYAIEKDNRCVAALKDLSNYTDKAYDIIHTDALVYAITNHIPEPRAIIANLPYNVGTALLIQWLDEIAEQGKNAYRFMTLMFQKEVAERLYAAPNSEHYGRLSVFTQWLCNIEYCFDLPPEAFSPPPKVYSTVVKLTPLDKPRFPADKSILEKTVAAAFGQRRKMLRSSLGTISPNATAWLETAGIDPTRRAETLSVDEFCNLSNHYKQ